MTRVEQQDFFPGRRLFKRLDEGAEVQAGVRRAFAVELLGNQQGTGGRIDDPVTDVVTEELRIGRHLGEQGGKRLFDLQPRAVRDPQQLLGGNAVAVGERRGDGGRAVGGGGQGGPRGVVVLGLSDHNRPGTRIADRTSADFRGAQLPASGDFVINVHEIASSKEFKFQRFPFRAADLALRRNGEDEGAGIVRAGDLEHPLAGVDVGNAARRGHIPNRLDLRDFGIVSDGQAITGHQVGDGQGRVARECLPVDADGRLGGDAERLANRSRRIASRRATSRRATSRRLQVDDQFILLRIAAHRDCLDGQRAEGGDRTHDRASLVGRDVADRHAVQRQQIGQTERSRSRTGLAIDRNGNAFRDIPWLARFGAVAGGQPERGHGRVDAVEQTGGLGDFRAGRVDLFEFDAVAAEVFQIDRVVDRQFGERHAFVVEVDAVISGVDRDTDRRFPFLARLEEEDPAGDVDFAYNAVGGSDDRWR